jgi:hypothetical protein
VKFVCLQSKDKSFLASVIQILVDYENKVPRGQKDEIVLAEL